MMGLCAMGSFSDAHETREIPIIAANLQRLILPRQSQVWAVLRKNDTASAPSPLHHIFGIEPPAGALRIYRTGLPGFDTAEKPSDLTAATPAQLALLRIVHGQPAWGLEITEDTLPQEARLEDTAVDFDKGCYVGQETVSRLKSVGRVNKRLHGFLGTLSADLPLPARSMHSARKSAPNYNPSLVWRPRPPADRSIKVKRGRH